MDSYPKKGYHISIFCLSCLSFSECFDPRTGGNCNYVSDDTSFVNEWVDLKCDFFIDKIEE